MSEDSISKMFTKLDEVLQRLSRMEAMREAKEKECQLQRQQIENHEKRLRLLEHKSAGWQSTLNFVCWLFTAAIAVYSLTR